MASPLQYGEASQFFELESSCSWIIAAIQWNKYDKLTFNLDHFKGAGQHQQIDTTESHYTSGEKPSDLTDLVNQIDLENKLLN